MKTIDERTLYNGRCTVLNYRRFIVSDFTASEKLNKPLRKLRLESAVSRRTMLVFESQIGKCCTVFASHCSGKSSGSLETSTN